MVQNVSGSGKDMGQGYVNFTRNCMDQIRGKVTDELWILNFFEQWYTTQINMLCNWLSERLDHSLHPYQCTCLAHIVKVIQFSFLFFNIKQIILIKTIFVFIVINIAYNVTPRIEKLCFYILESIFRF